MLRNISKRLILSNRDEFSSAVSKLSFETLNSFRNCSDLPAEVKKINKALEKDEGSPMLKAFSGEKKSFLELHRYNPMTVSPQRLREWNERRKRNFEIFQQRYIEQRHNILGSDLATANFIVYRKGKVKFHKGDKWIEKKDDEDICQELPTTYVRDLYLECIDASGTNIRYEGLENFTNLNKLKWLSLRNCEHVDDWFLDRISGEFGETLEYLDISDCRNVTENGLNGFYRFKKLKKLVVHNIVNSISFEFRCFLLEDTIPGLVIDGVKYLDAK